MNDNEREAEFFFNILQQEIDNEINQSIVHQLKTGEVTCHQPEPYTGPDVFGLAIYGDHQYGVRGVGSTYNEFYDHWDEIKPYVVSDSDDWPWHYFTLRDDAPADLLDRWKAFTL